MFRVLLINASLAKRISVATEAKLCKAVQFALGGIPAAVLIVPFVPENI